MTEYEQVVRALRSPDAYPERPPLVDHVQTHISHLFLTPQFVYKLKKPVNFGFLDFSTFERRQHYCERELALNRRMSPDVYLEVTPVCAGAGGRIALGGSGRVVEHVVKMLRLPSDRLMARLLEANQVTVAMVRELGRIVGRFHGNAETGAPIGRFGSRETIAAMIEENLRESMPFVGSIVSRRKFDRLREESTHFLRAHAALLDRRVAEGRIRDCHGDLHAAQVFFTERGARIIDCIEFNDGFRYIDVASDVAFMAMDLDHAGRYDLSRAFVDAWREVAGDREVPALLEFYKTYRATVRGKVESLRGRDRSLPRAERAEAARRARSYFNLAYYYTQRRRQPVLLLCAGMVGTGKSTLARRVAEDAGFAVLSSDVVRKQLAGIPAEQRGYSGFEGGLYTPELTARTHHELLEQARPLLQEGHAVVLDATFARRAQRVAAAALADEVGAEYWVVECVASERAIRERLRRRKRRGTGASDADWEIYRQGRSSFEPVDEVPSEHHIVIPTSEQSVAESARTVLNRLGVG